jgi:dipeptidyl aminopeptidase/acylaminoacyl peptidase
MLIKPLLAASAVTLLIAPLTMLRGQKHFALTIDNIMRGPNLVGYEPSNVRWSGDDERIYFEWKQASEPIEKPMDTYVVDRDGSGLHKLSDEETRLAPPSRGELSEDKSMTVYAVDGDIYLWDHSKDQARRVTQTTDAESNPHFTRDGRHIVFTRDDNLYRMSLDTGLIEQLTDIRAANAPRHSAPTPGAFGFGRGEGGAAAPAEPEKRGTASQETLKKEQSELFEVVREREAVQKEQEARRKLENPRKPFTLPPTERIGALTLSPDESTVVAVVIEPGKGAKRTTVPEWVTDTGYVGEIPGRTNVGDPQSQIRIALIDVKTGAVKWVDHGQRAEAPPEKPAEEAQQTAAPKHTGAARGAEQTGRHATAQPHEREVRLFQPVWSDDGSKAVLMGRSADNKDRWIFALDLATGKTRVIAHDHDDAWIDGPGAYTLGWVNNDEIYFQSERAGYSHLYTVPYAGGEPRPLTSGNWEVEAVTLSKDKKTFYLTTNKGNPADQDLYSLPVTGGELTEITRLPGNHHTVLSHNEQWIADIHSYVNKPPEIYAMENRPGADEKKLTSSPAADFWDYPWYDPPIVHIRARDGAEVPAQLFKPANFKKGGPAVIFVHGAGYLQNVDHWWSSYYFREYMFHNLLMARGYMVVAADYRGSAGYGRDWRTAIYRHMGGKDLDDEVDVAKWLVSHEGVDPRKIGIYGGSYGGFITLMAMFKEPDVFAAGAALRPVSDWALYNDGYTSDILNLPQNDAAAYRDSSPIYFADGLKGALLICHGMVDTNVHFEDTVRLVQKLIELRKTNWWLAVYPVENHGFIQPTSWADEYKRILNLFDKNLK